MVHASKSVRVTAFAEGTVVRAFLRVLGGGPLSEVAIGSVYRRYRVGEGAFCCCFGSVCSILRTVFRSRIELIVSRTGRNIAFRSTCTEITTLVLGGHRTVVRVCTSRGNEMLEACLSTIIARIIHHFILRGTRNCDLSSDSVTFVATFCDGKVINDAVG